jgi:multidrug efflux pump subunit AcrB
MNIKNAVILVDKIGEERRRKVGRDVDAVMRAVRSRVLPVTLASGTTILGMLPLLPDSMFGGMAATIMGGLLVATFLTIFVLPVTYSLFYGVKVDD